jgi:hypothetical protein
MPLLRSARSDNRSSPQSLTNRRPPGPTQPFSNPELAAVTGWRIGGASAWVWVATTAEVTYYNVARGRGFDRAVEVIDADFAGTIVRDGWAPYRQYD